MTTTGDDYSIENLKARVVDVLDEVAERIDALEHAAGNPEAMAAAAERLREIRVSVQDLADDLAPEEDEEGDEDGDAEPAAAP